MNSAELYMQARVTLDHLNNTMLNGVTPASVREAATLVADVSALNDIVCREHAERVAKEADRVAAHEARTQQRAVTPVPGWDCIDTSSDDPSTLTAKVRAELLAGSGHMRHDHIF